jgi:uncharacterized 2Fe-2S/4Fe-4S cluster protein (DUF4445 family)
MRAGDGAISRLRITSASPLKVEHEVLGAAQKPVGICGSGYVDFLAEGRRVGLLTPAGRFDRAAVDVQTLRRRLSTGKDGLAVPVFSTASGCDVVVSEADVARLLQAKAAIAAGIVTLLRRLNLRPGDVSRVCLAGGFGMHVEVANAIRCGLLPDFQPEQVRVIGNSSLAGAYLALLDRAVMDELERIRQNVSVVELNQDEQFESCYIDQLVLP